jgi:hypothetical protein
MQELLSLSGESTAEEDIIQKLADASLLTTEGDLTHGDAFVEVAHEALIRSWPQLRKWIDADRTGLRTRTRLTEAARDTAYFYTGARLAVTEEWAASRPGELSVGEAEFLRCSREAHNRREATDREIEIARELAEEQKRRTELSEAREKEQKEAARKLRGRAFAAAGAAIAMVILLVMSVGLWREVQKQAEMANALRAQAEEQTHMAESRRLAAQIAEEIAKKAEGRANDAEEKLKALSKKSQQGTTAQ